MNNKYVYIKIDILNGKKRRVHFLLPDYLVVCS